jgi:hypothetical protein
MSNETIPTFTTFSALSWRELKRFQEDVRSLIILPNSGSDPLDHLLSEEQWLKMFPPGQDWELEMMSLSQASGVYFFPSKEWVYRCCRFIKKLGINRVLEAGAGRGYLAAALGPMLAQNSIVFKAIDSGEVEFLQSNAIHPIVRPGDIFTEIWEFRPEMVVYAWPPPGQSLAAICSCPYVRYLMVIGELGGGCTGLETDWKQLRHRQSPSLSRYGTARSGRSHYAVTIFYGDGNRPGTGDGRPGTKQV